ncbi:head GIN domain-containing protein [Hymenobacter latericus]|uniref:head GIN domain-containing protein n=1 Tax=Hymenobacter sp. YIM 151858-1 TaxID=2987688 RepID=UPI0022275863|nr:head GIN domain-containing protein [Hymenobacter sp. YIM 151858-1]UYZ57956.1 DUF2807 domain-containing protein [Hymenobacter sp. YIM 151858-1]
MRTSTLFRTLAVAALVVSAQAVAVAQGQLRQVGAFRQVKASGAVNVVLRQAAAQEVRVEARPEVQARVRTVVENGTLRIYRESGSGWSSLNWGKDDQVTVYVTAPTLTGVEVSGASELKSASPIQAEQFSIRVSGASDVTLQLNAQSLSATASGASDIRLAGRVAQQQVQVSGSSDYRAYELQSQKAVVQASGASDAYVYVDGDLQARSSGASDVHYKGRARVGR